MYVPEDHIIVSSPDGPKHCYNGLHEEGPVDVSLDQEDSVNHAPLN
jgi:hypothetical protein